MGTFSTKLDETLTAETIRAKIAAFKTLYSEDSEFFVQHGNVFLHGIQPELVRIGSGRIIRVADKYLVVRTRFDNLIDTTVKVLLPSARPNLYRNIGLQAKLFFRTRR